MTENITAVHCELASLYALNALDEMDAHEYEQHLVDGCPACRLELDRLKFAVDLLALAPKPVAPPPSLRSRVLDAARSASRGPAGPSPASLEFEERGSWRAHSAPGIDYRVLHLDRASREIVMLVRARPGARYPVHQHAAQEDMFMLRGELLLDGMTYRPGDFIRSSSGSRHGVGETPSGCMFLMRGSIDDLVLERGESNSDTATPRAEA